MGSVVRRLTVPAMVVAGVVAMLASSANARAVEDEDRPTAAGPSAAQPPSGGLSDATVAPSSPTDVKIGVTVEQITRIEERDNLFEVDATLTSQWTDKRGRPECPAPDQVFDDELAEEVLKATMWAPTFVVDLGRGPRETTALALTVNCDGTVTYQERFSTEVSQRFTDLNDFPFDDHEIRFTIEPFGTSGPNDIRFETFTAAEAVELGIPVDEKAPDKQPSDEWNFTVHAEPEVTAVPASITTSVRIDREWRFFWWNIIGPLMAIVGISWIVFWMKPVLHERLAVSITILLTVVAFDFLTGDSLPRLPFTTRLDMFYNVSYFFVAVTIVLSVIATRPRKYFRRPERTMSRWSRLIDWLSPRTDRWARRLYVPAYVVVVAVVLSTGLGSRGRGEPPPELREAVEESVPEELESTPRLDPASPESGSIDEIGERDEFEVCGVPDDTVRVRMERQPGASDDTLDPLLELYSREDRLLVTFDDDGAGDLNSLLVVPPGEECYVLVASDFRGEGVGGYTLTLRLGEAPVIGESEADDLDADELDADEATVERAIELVVGTTQTAAISEPGDIHSYQVCGVADAGELSVRMAQSPDDVDSLLDPFLVLYDEDGTYLAEDDDGAGGLDSLLVLPESEGCLTILAGDYDDSAAGTYTITLEESAPELASDTMVAEFSDVESRFGVSFDDLVDQGVAVDVDEERTDTIGAPGDVDAYIVCSPSDGTDVSVMMKRTAETTTDTLDPLLVAYDADGMFAMVDDNGAANLDSLLVLPADDDCRVVVAADFSGEGTGDYTLVVRAE